MGIAASKAVRDRVANLAPAEIAKVYAELPERGKRSEAEIDVTIGLSLAYTDKWRPIASALTCRALVQELRSRVGSDGRYVSPHGDPVELSSNVSNVVTDELERRFGIDLFTLWEEQGGDVDADAETDAWTRWEIAEIERRCSTTPEHNSQCPHNAA